MNAKGRLNSLVVCKKLIYDQNSQDIKIYKGLPIIARINNRKLDICNNEEFEVVNYANDMIKITDGDRTIDIPFDEFSRHFYPAYAITVHKAQGSTYTNSFSIHEWRRFDDRLKYVALSRANDIKIINFC